MPVLSDQPPAVVRQLSAEELAQQGLPRVAELLKNAETQDTSKLSLRALQIEGATFAPADRTIYSKEQIEKDTSPASLFATKQMDINKDQKITVEELRKYGYVADQIGNKDGKLTIEEYNQLFSRGIQESLLDTARKVGVSEHLQKVLEGRFATGQFGLTGTTGLPDAIDIAQASRDAFITAEKTIIFSGLTEAAINALPNGSGPQFAKTVLEHLASTGVTLIPVKKLGDGKLQLAGDSVEVSEGHKGSKVYRAKSEIFEYSPATGKLTSVEVQQAESTFTIVGDDKYKHSSKSSNPLLDREIQRVLHAIKNDPQIKDAITELKKATDGAAPPPTELKRLLIPISNKLQETLGLQPAIPLEVKVRNPESPQVLASYAHPVPGSGQKAKIELFMAPFLTEAETAARAFQESGKDRNTSVSLALEGFRRNVLSSLVEETFHAMQHSMIDTFIVDPKKISPEISSRVSDYALNREFLVSPVDSKPYFGTIDAYENQPIEADAKKFRSAVVDEILRRK